MVPVVDLHCDLLSYLTTGEGRSSYDRKSRTAIPQLLEGGVVLQALAIFTEKGAHSVEDAAKQVDAFCALQRELPAKIRVIAAIENASGLLEEDEPLELAFERLDRMMKRTGPLLYMSLTWNEANRFGGGNDSDLGLTDDGKKMLDEMAERGVAVDFSHTSDRLARDILEYIDQKNLRVKVLASHSNFRAIENRPRNLPDWLARQIIERDGVIGLNLFAPFIGKQVEDLMRHVAYGLQLGGGEALSFGADLFYDDDFQALTTKYDGVESFFNDYADASCYPLILERLALSDLEKRKIASENAFRFIGKI